MIGRGVALAGLCLLAASCGQDKRPSIAWPALPALPREVAAECPPAELLTGELADLATKDAALAIEYARCRAGKAAAVAAYNQARDDLARVAEAAESVP